MRSTLPALVLLVTIPANAGIAFQSRVHGKQGDVVTNVVAEGAAYRSEVEVTKEMDEWLRQYPIAISTDGKTMQRLRPEDRTWYTMREQRVADVVRLGGIEARVRKPQIRFAEEPSQDVIAGMATRKFALNASYVVETKFDRETVKQNRSRTVLLWIADMPCAPPISRALLGVTFGVPELDDAVDREIASWKGLIVRKVDSQSEAYAGGGAPQVNLSTTEIVDPKCVDVDAAKFAIPKGYREQEPVVSGVSR